MSRRLKFFFGVLCALTFPSLAFAEDGFQLGEVIAQLKREISAAQSVVIGAPRFVLDKVVITLSISKIVDGAGTVSIGIPFANLGGELAQRNESVSTLTVELVPPRPVTFMGGDELAGLHIAQMIVDVRRQLQEGLVQEPLLSPEKFSLSVKFGVTKVADANVGVRFLVFSVSGEGSLTTAAISTLIMSFSATNEP